MPDERCGHPAIVDEILAFWFVEHGRPDWFQGGPAFDVLVRDRFEAAHRNALASRYDAWLGAPSSALALVLALDQFPRNIYRGKPQAFAADGKALAMAKAALVLGHDRDMTGDERKFLYMPFMHSERVAEQERCCELMRELGDEEAADYADRHLQVIQKFGRFPHRNPILRRRNTEAEEAYLAQPGAGF